MNEIENKISQIPQNHDRQVALLLHNMKLAFITANQKITNSQNQNIGEIDLLFTLDDYLFIIEVSKDKYSGSDKKIKFFIKWSEPENLEALEKQFSLRSRKTFRIYFDLSTKETPQNPSTEIERITRKERMSKVVYLDDYEYFQNYVKKIGSWARNDFFDWVGVEDEKKSREINAIQYYINDTPVFCFVERVDNLLHTCYVSRRKSKDLGYQRTLKENRVAEISRNIKNGRGLSFPNSILIWAPTLTNSLARKAECPKIVKINFPISYNNCRIIDGQHRLLGFSAVEPEIQESYFLPVIALQEYDRNNEIKTFVDINSKQQKIDGNLILLLKADLDWDPITKEAKQKIAVLASKELNKTFFKNKIYFGEADDVKGNKITLTTLVSSMIHNNLVQDNLTKTTRKLTEVFSYMQKYLFKHTFGSDKIYFGQNQGINVLFRLVYLMQRNFEANTIEIPKEDFFKDLGIIFNDEVSKKVERQYGLGGVKEAAAIIINELKSKFSKYAKMESNLNLLRKKRK